MDGDSIDSILYNHRNDEIVSAVNKMLTNWLRQYRDKKVACGDLISALRKCGLQGLIPQVFAEEYNTSQSQEVSVSMEPVTEISASASRIPSPDLDIADFM